MTAPEPNPAQQPPDDEEAAAAPPPPSGSGAQPGAPPPPSDQPPSGGPPPEEPRSERPGMRDQFARTRAAAFVLVNAHRDLLRAELAVIG